MVSTHLKNISQIGSFPQVGMNIKKYVKPPPRLQYQHGAPIESIHLPINLHNLTTSDLPQMHCYSNLIYSPVLYSTYQYKYMCIYVLHTLIDKYIHIYMYTYNICNASIYLNQPHQNHERHRCVFVKHIYSRHIRLQCRDDIHRNIYIYASIIYIYK